MERADIEARLAADEWLQAGAIALLADVSRSTIYAWISAGKLKMRSRRTLGGRTHYHPDDVRKLLADLAEVDDPGAAE